ncbi:immunoglobulin-like domain-containing protein, partial [Pseudomonas sp. DCB_Q]|uniref:immunoglobulin-like domain-containing protein n=1 Tax=Pseudomonas sp. DCB_Q TaxID=2993589 RepID=UPI0022703DC7
LGITSAVDVDGRTFENLELGGAAKVDVTDTTDEVVAKLTATPSVTEGGEITYTITLTNKDGLPINNHSALTFTLSDGKTVITVPANGTVGTATEDAGQISLGINSAVDATGAAFENLELGGAASVQVTDTLDEVVAKLTATPSVTEGGEITYTITLTNKDGLPINNHSALTFTLSDGKTVITVPANG